MNEFQVSIGGNNQPDDQLISDGKPVRVRTLNQAVVLDHEDLFVHLQRGFVSNDLIQRFEILPVKPSPGDPGR